MRRARASWATVVVIGMVVSVLGAPAHAAPQRSPEDPFAGVGTWVSIFMDTWEHPRQHVRRMHRLGVTTLYLQTSSSQTPVDRKIFEAAKVGTFIDAAHAHGMKVVAWYLPPLADVAPEYDRAMAAIRFRSSSGQRFDGFALDIEPSARTPGVKQRNENLLRLSRKIRRAVGADYPLGAIIPSPVGMRLSPEFWPRFPYEGIGRVYDTILPMSYHTWRVTGPAATSEYTRRNIRILRRHYGPDVRIHMIGGEAGASNRRETRAFVRTAYDAGALGASLWHYGTHDAADWEELHRLEDSDTSAAATRETTSHEADVPAEPEAGAPGPLELAVTADRTAFSPNRDGRGDEVTITTGTTRRATHTAEVRDAAGVVVRRWRSSAPTRSLSVTWSGRRDRLPLPDGRYVVRTRATDGNGSAEQARLLLRLDTQSPTLRLRRLAHPFDASEPLQVRYAAWAGAGGVSLRLQLNDLRPIRVTADQRPSGRDTLQIAPRYADGHRLLPGEYDVALTATDSAGNEATRRRRLVVIRPVRAQIFERLATRQRKVALTFDDCHLTRGWANILRTLKRHAVTATFFCPGDRLELYPELGRRTVADGHVAASHGWDHRMMTRLSYDAMKQRLVKDQAAWARLGGTAVTYFRPPYGDVNSTVVAAAGAAGYARVMLWDIDSRDYTGISGQRLVCNAVCDAQPGSVILLHTNDRTAAALPDIITRLRRRGLEPVGLPELFHSAGHH